MLGKKITVFHPYLVERGGSQRYAIDLCNALKNKGFDVELLTFYYNKENCFPELTKDISVIALYYPIKYKKAVNILNNINFINKIIINSGILIVLNTIKMLFLIHKLKNKKLIKKNNSIIINESGIFNLLAKYYKYKIIIIYDTNDKIIKWSKNNIFLLKYKLLVDFIILKCTKRHWIYIFNKIYVLDKEMKNYVKNYYKYNSIILKPGVLSIATNEKKFNESEINILCNSRISKYKRLEDLIYLGEKLKINKKLFKININAPIEDNNYYNKLKKEIEFYNLYKNITINTNHFTDDNELLETYNKNDIFIFPSENQTWGQAVLEAMALGMVVIVSKGCGIHSIIENGINGFVYDTGNINELIRIILGIDKIKFELISSNAVNFVKKNYDWNHSVNLIINE